MKLDPDQITAQLDKILKQAPEPFPKYPSGQGTPFGSIVAQLGVDPRTQYGVVGQSLSVLLTTLETQVKRPTDISETDWNPVFDQIKVELQAAIAIRGLFSALGKYLTTVFVDGGARLNYVSGLVQITGGTSVAIKVLDVLNSALGWLSLIPGIGTGGKTVIGGMKLLIGIVNKKGGLPSINASVAALWNELRSSFDNLVGAAQSTTVALVSDWGRMRACYALITDGSLEWPLDTSELVAKAGMGYELVLWQTLAPKVWAIETVACGNWKSDCGWRLKSDDNLTYYIWMSSGYQPYWICLNQGLKYDDPPTKSMCDRLFSAPSAKGDTGGLGVEKLGFFLCQGWDFYQMPPTDQWTPKGVKKHK